MKLSGLLTEAGDGQGDAEHLAAYVRPLLEAFGPRRLMFGSDWPVCTLAAEYGRTLSITAQLLETLDDAGRAAGRERDVDRPPLARAPLERP